MDNAIRESIQMIWKQLLKSQPTSRAELAKQCGFSKVTASSCVDWLLEKGLVQELGVTEIRRGRPPMLLSVNGEAGVLAGIEADKISSKIVVTDLAGNLLERHDLPAIDAEPKTFVNQVAAYLKQFQKTYADRRLGVVGVGFAIVGSYNQEEGTIEYVANQMEWNHYPFRLEMEKMSPEIPFLVSQIAKVSALGEVRFGDGDSSDYLAFLSANWGIGVGLYDGVTGHLTRTTRFGHATIDYNGKPCICGNRGCLEAYASIRALFEQFYPEETPSFSLFQDLVQRLRSGDEKVVSAVYEMAEYLAIGIVNVINAYNPRQICIGGLLSFLITDEMLSKICSLVDDMVPPHFRKDLRIYVSRLGDMAAVYGCVAMIRDQLTGFFGM
ncbi:ROK family protein [Hominifimenecus sp. rT4P-3]|uniref:ROK family protein n=1 Tax=Hominifimenecus sp. rT4P-3 TaxID=3242979 RepID=UPI003DA2645B